MTAKRGSTVESRFWEKVDKSGECWVWTANRLRGYGQFKTPSGPIRAHRMAWMLLRGPIPDGLTIDHLCCNRACVNPAHMELVTPGINTLRGDTITAANLRKTCCPQGHPYSHRDAHGGRACRTCLYAAERKYRAANRDAYNARKREKRAAGLWA